MIKYEIDENGFLTGNWAEIGGFENFVELEEPLAEIDLNKKWDGTKFVISSNPKVAEKEKQKRIEEIQARLTELDQDIVQDLVGEAVPNIEKRKSEFVTLHNELRVLLGKEERELKNTTDNLTQKSEQTDDVGLDGTNTHGNTHEQIKQSN